MTQLVDRDVDLLLVGVNGAAWTTDLGATAPAAPADPALTPANSWIPCGAVSEEGLTEGFAEDRTDIRVWGLLAPFRTIVTSSVRTFQLTLMEISRDIAASVMYRVTLASLARVSGIRSIADSSTPTPDRRAWLFRSIDGDVVQQYYVPLGEITDRTDVQHTSTDAAKYQLTVTAYPDSVGNTVYMIDNAPVTPAQSNS